MTSKPTETELLPEQGITEDRARALASNDELPILEILLRSSSPIATNRWKLQVAKEIAALPRTPSLSDAQARDRADKLLADWSRDNNASLYVGADDLSNRIAAALSTPQPTLSDAVQAESDAYAQGYQDGSVSQPTLQQAIECVRDYRKWYDEKMFTPVTTEETQAVHKQFDGMVDRISAAMARHLIDKLIEQLESLASTQE